MHTGNISIWEIRSCIPICVILHTGIAVCIRGSLYANGQGLLNSLHMRILLRIMKLCAYGDYHIWGVPVCIRGVRQKNLHMGRPITHNEVVRIRGLTYYYGVP